MAVLEWLLLLLPLVELGRLPSLPAFVQLVSAFLGELHGSVLDLVITGEQVLLEGGCHHLLCLSLLVIAELLVANGFKRDILGVVVQHWLHLHAYLTLAVISAMVVNAEVIIVLHHPRDAMVPIALALDALMTVVLVLVA